MEVICEIGICNREKNARARAHKRENFSEESESNVEQKEKKIGRDVARVIKILLRENVNILRDRIGDARLVLLATPRCISRFIIINASLNPFPVIRRSALKKRFSDKDSLLKEFASREDTRKRGRDISDLLGP